MLQHRRLSCLLELKRSDPAEVPLKQEPQQSSEVCVTTPPPCLRAAPPSTPTRRVATRSSSLMGHAPPPRREQMADCQQLTRARVVRRGGSGLLRGIPNMMSLLIPSGKSQIQRCWLDAPRLKQPWVRRSKYSCPDVKGDWVAAGGPPTNQGLPEEDSLVTQSQNAGPRSQNQPPARRSARARPLTDVAAESCNSLESENVVLLTAHES